MKMKLHYIIIILLALVFSFESIGYANGIANFADLAVGDEITSPKLPKDKKYYLIEKATIDINGDKVKDQILVVGEKDNPKSLITKRVFLVIMDKKTNKEMVFPLTSVPSYSPTIYFGDMNGDGTPEILNELPQQSGTGSYYILTSLKNNKLKIYSDENGLKRFFEYTSEFKDGFVADVKSQYLDVTVPVTLNGFKKLYISEGIYNNSGKLLKKVTTKTDQVLNLHFEDKNKDGKEELAGEVVLTGISLSDRFASVFLRIEMIDDKLVLTNVDICGKMYSADVR